MKKALTGQKFKTGEECPKTSLYGQFHDNKNRYAGKKYDRQVTKGDKFPQNKGNHHFKEINII